MQPLNGSVAINKINAQTGMVDGTTTAAGACLLGY